MISKNKKIALIISLLYLLQILVLCFFVIVPVEKVRFEAVSVVVSTKKDVGPLSFIPFAGWIVLLREENYHVIIETPSARKSIGIDLREDLPTRDLKAALVDGAIVVSRKSTGAVIHRF